MKLFFKIILSVFFVYAAVWSYNNVDFRSVFKDSGNLLKYELEKENFTRTVDSFVTTIKKHLTCQ